MRSPRPVVGTEALRPGIIRTLAFQLATRLPEDRTFLKYLPEIKELDREQTAAELSLDQLIEWRPLRAAGAIAAADLLGTS